MYWIAVTIEWTKTILVKEFQTMHPKLANFSQKERQGVIQKLHCQKLSVLLSLVDILSGNLNLL